MWVLNKLFMKTGSQDHSIYIKANSLTCAINVYYCTYDLIIVYDLLLYYDLIIHDILL